MKKFALFFNSILIITLLMVGCNKKIEESNVVINPIEPLNYSFKYENFKDIVKLLEKQKYSYNISADDFKFISVAIVGNEDIKVKEYKVNYRKEIDISVPKNSTFIISFPENTTILNLWKIKNKINENIFTFDKKYKLKIANPHREKEFIMDGESYSRVAFYFSSKNIGKEKLHMVYSQDDDESGTFDINNEWSTDINVNVSD